ncbi:ribonuclease PH [Roseibacillus ishigakijimensis]|uniref:Ribonuclease PH n=1 Tax=Roseibacillus ishigakijimensis TaxID=454146 RepID=A0A934VLI2_9BACT|nr:ribonuclease PH [Roseibacillus ishigakijimensis]MBK1833267.1 ribonuclease PH [Roseibacillus ishigakijimensis]
MTRPDGRQADEMRELTFTPNVAPHASGSVLVSFGNTRVICAATIEESVPGWMRYQKVEGGWLTAEYSMLPYSTHDRKRRDITSGKLDGRSTEIQRLIGRSLRAVIDLKKLGARTLWVDCDVLQADGGTRTASITGGCVASAIAINKLMAEGKLNDFPMKSLVAAISCGVYQDEVVLDLNYPEDKDASVDSNLVMTENLSFVEMQMSGEEATFSEDQMAQMVAVGKKGISEIVVKQREAILAAERAEPVDLASLAAAFQK